MNLIPDSVLLNSVLNGILKLQTGVQKVWPGTGRMQCNSEQSITEKKQMVRVTISSVWTIVVRAFAILPFWWFNRIHILLVFFHFYAVSYWISLSAYSHHSWLFLPSGIFGRTKRHGRSLRGENFEKRCHSSRWRCRMHNDWKACAGIAKKTALSSPTAFMFPNHGTFTCVFAHFVWCNDTNDLWIPLCNKLCIWCHAINLIHPVMV